MENPNLDRLRAKANSLVEQPGVYLMKDRNKNIIYIGKAKRLKHRVVSYFRQNKGHTEKVRKMVSLVHDFDYIVTASEFEALVLECSLIKQYDPKYNILLKDDKGYSYIKITNEPFPRIQAALQKLDDGATYIGPYTSSYSVKQSVLDVNQVFLLPTCGKKFPAEFRKARPCLNYHIHNCSGICRGRTSQADYAALIEDAIAYLKGGSSQSIERLSEQMEEAAESLDFEKAAKLRDRIKAIQKLKETQKVLRNEGKDHDYIGVQIIGDHAAITILQFRGGKLHNKKDYDFTGFNEKAELLEDFLTQYYRKDTEIPSIISMDEALENMELYEQFFNSLTDHRVYLTVPQKGEQKRLIEMAQNNALETLSHRMNQKSRELVALRALADLLGLEKIPEYIESYDISNIGNDYMVGGMVVFQNAKPFRSAYKKYSMKDNVTQDDYACTREMLRRRFNHYLDPNETDEGFKRLPDLILLDGGNGHVNAVAPLLQEMGISVPLFGMVKDSKHRTRAIAAGGTEIQIAGVQSAFRLVTQIQDEVHRFAISFQRKTHKKNAFSMQLTTVRGIGTQKAKTLFKHFKTKKALKEASLTELQEVAKISAETAKNLWEIIQNF